jgi:hypothetical protein
MTKEVEFEERRQKKMETEGMSTRTGETSNPLEKASAGKPERLHALSKELVILSSWVARSPPHRRVYYTIRLEP